MQTIEVWDFTFLSSSNLFKKKTRLIDVLVEFYSWLVHLGHRKDVDTVMCILSDWSRKTRNNAPLAMHYLSDIRPEPARGLISFWYQTWGLISFWYQTWGLISFWYQTCDGSGFEFVRTKYVQHQLTLQLFSTMDETSHLCRFTLVVCRFD